MPSFSELLTSAKRMLNGNGVSAVTSKLKYLNPYYPAKVMVDRGDTHLAVAYFASWYVIIPYVIIKLKNRGKKDETQVEKQK